MLELPHLENHDIRRLLSFPCQVQSYPLWRVYTELCGRTAT